jgi:peptide/nickel transport system substrate-binding protein
MPDIGKQRDSSTSSRRGFLKSAGGAAVVASMAGCTGSDNNQDTTTAGDTQGSGEDDDSESTPDESEVQQGGTLTFARGNSSATLDPQQGRSTEDAKVTNQIFNSLIEMKPGTAELTAGLATEWEVVDDTTIQFQLREGVQFHNGAELTSEDVVATYRRYTDEEYDYYLGEENVSAAELVYTAVEDVEADGDYTVVTSLSRPFAPVLNNFAQYHFGIFPASVIEEAGDQQQQLGEEPVGTGAFQLKNWNKSNQTIRLSAFDDYWGEGPHVDEVVFEVIQSNSTRAQTLDTGGADVIDGLGSQAIQLVRGSNNAELLKKPGLNFGFMSMNMTEVEAFRDERVRAAFNHAIDTEKIVNEIFGDLAQPATQSIPEPMVGHNEDLELWPYNPEKAQQLLEEAGYSDLSVELAVMTNPRPYIPAPEPLSNTIKSYLEDVGVSITINRMSWSPMLEYTLGEMNHELCFLGWSSVSGSPNDLTYPLFHPGVSIDEVPEGQDWVSKEKIMEERNSNTITGWANKEYMRLIEEAQASYDSSVQEENYSQAMKILHDSPCDVMLTHASLQVGVHNQVNNYIQAAVKGPFLQHVSLEN